MSKTAGEHAWNRLIKAGWSSRSLNEKISALGFIVFAIILMTVLLDIWTIKISLWDFRYSLQSNELVGTLVEAVEQESEGLGDYTRGDISRAELDVLMDATDKAVGGLQKDYNRIGEERVAWTEKTGRAFEIYRKECAEFFKMDPLDPDYIAREYKLFQMQDYLKNYGSTLMSLTSRAVNDFYKQRFPLLFFFPAIILAVAVIMITVVAKTSSAMNKTLVEPIGKLADASRKIAANDLDVEDIVVDNKDEIGDLVHAFNKMKFATSEYIRTLEENRVALDRLHAEELDKIDAENRLVRMRYQVLRNQINPHFLFNTLCVISGMAKLEDAGTTDKMINALSSLLRYILRTEENEITLEQELAMIRDYMYLQEMRFGERIKCVIDCDSELNKAYVPTFVIQPIVENSIIHGLAKKEEGGYIRIHVFTALDQNDEKLLSVVVSDTGVGIPAEKLAQIRESLTGDNEERNTIGISNIYGRLKLLYENSEFEIDSIEGEGTVVKFTIPYSK